MKKLKKCMSVLLCFLMVISMITIMPTMNVRAEEETEETVVTTWAGVSNYISQGKNIKLGNDIVA